MRITASLEAGRYIRERGGRVYIWLRDLGRSGWGMLKVSTDAPREQIDFSEYEGGGFQLLLDLQLARPDEIRVELRRRPFRRLRVRGFRAGEVAGTGGGGGNGGDDREDGGVIWWDGGDGGGGGGGDGGGGGNGG